MHLLQPPLIHLDDAQTTSIIAAAVLILLDYVSGIAKAFATHTVSSAKMRDGLWHKSGYVLVIVLGVIVDETQKHIDLGINVPVTVAAGIYICLTEITSILENAAIINPDLSAGLREIFKSAKQPAADTTDTTESSNT